MCQVFVVLDLIIFMLFQCDAVGGVVDGLAGYGRATAECELASSGDLEHG